MLFHLALLASAFSSAISVEITLPSLSQTPFNASQILDRALASFSIEFSFLDVFCGNKSHPNELTKRLMDRLVERTNVGPDIRPGGITM